MRKHQEGSIQQTRSRQTQKDTQADASRSETSFGTHLLVLVHQCPRDVLEGGDLATKLQVGTTLVPLLLAQQVEAATAHPHWAVVVLAMNGDPVGCAAVAEHLATVAAVCDGKKATPAAATG